MRIRLALVTALAVSPASAGTASWYALHGQETANGEIFDQGAATCAHKSLPFGTILLVTNLKNGRRASCRVNDRGPYVRGRSLDVSRAVAIRLGMVRSGVAPVKIEVVGGA